MLRPAASAFRPAAVGCTTSFTRPAARVVFRTALVRFVAAIETVPAPGRVSRTTVPLRVGVDVPIRKAFGRHPEGVAAVHVPTPPTGEDPVGEDPVGEAPVGEAPLGEAPVGDGPAGRPPPGAAPATAAGPHRRVAGTHGCQDGRKPAGATTCWSAPADVAVQTWPSRS